MENREKLDFIVNVVKQAGALLNDKFLKTEVAVKGDLCNTVTEADLLSEKLITSAINEKYPDHSVLGEEEAATGVSLSAPQLWIIDPLDGTNNYASGMPHFSISVAYCESGVPVVGVVYDPVRDELFSALRGEGTRLNGKSVKVAERPVLAESLVATGFYYDRGLLMEKTLDSMKLLFHHGIRGIRRCGSAALDLAWVASGRFDGYFEYQLAPWDFAAGVLLVIEAGGIVCCGNGTPFTLAAEGIIAASDKIEEEFCNLIQWQKD